MNDQPSCRALLLKRHVQGIADQLGGMLGAMALPTTLREERSITTARDGQPAPVRMYVMSDT
jgi:hypothetical protein